MNRDWVDKDFYQILGVGSEATPGRDQEGLSQAGTDLSPRRQPGE